MHYPFKKDFQVFCRVCLIEAMLWHVFIWQGISSSGIGIFFGESGVGICCAAKL
jgi:hypothetical protein